MDEQQLVLDWRMVRGATFSNAVVERCCCITPKQLYRERKQLHYRNRGWFTYGEAVTLVMVNAACIPLHSEKRMALRALARLLDATRTEYAYVGIAQREGQWFPYATPEMQSLDGDVVLVAHLPTVSESLASVHALTYNSGGVTQASAS